MLQWVFALGLWGLTVYAFLLVLSHQTFIHMIICFLLICVSSIVTVNNIYNSSERWL